jgi:hypothetical protein
VVFIDQKRSPATVGAFLKHLKNARIHLLESIIVSYLAGFERFLKDWSFSALIIVGSANANKLAEIVNSENRNVRLDHVVDAFKDATGPALRRQIPLTRSRRSERAENFYSQRGLSCIQMTDMWRQVRNVIVHHEGILSKMEKAEISNLWKNFSRIGPVTAAESVESDPPIDAQRVHLRAHHVVYCFTNTYTTAKVLMNSLQELAREI